MRIIKNMYALLLIPIICVAVLPLAWVLFGIRKVIVAMESCLKFAVNRAVCRPFGLREFA